MTPPQSIHTAYRATSQNGLQGWPNPELIEDLTEAIHPDRTHIRICAYRPSILSAEEAANSPNAVPIFDIKAAAGDFSKEQWLQDCENAELPDHFTVKPEFFLSQVVGESTNRRNPNGSWCLFREPSDGSRNGKVVIFQSLDIQDPDTGGQYTVKIYRSEKTETGESRSHRNIRLDPHSNAPASETLQLEAHSSTDLNVIGEFVAIAA